MEKNMNYNRTIHSNQIVLQGTVAGQPVLTHTTHGIDFYTVPFSVPRKSGTEDVLNVVVSHPDPALWQVGKWLTLMGEVHSCNNHTDTGRKVVITVRVRSAYPDEPVTMTNQLVLQGVLCKPPVYRHTPLGRKICDLTLAVNRSHGRSDYLPCIAWGNLAGLCGSMAVGTEITFVGRLQSRTYSKITENGMEDRVAYEVSVMHLLDAAHPQTAAERRCA